MDIPIIYHTKSHNVLIINFITFPILLFMWQSQH